MAAPTRSRPDIPRGQLPDLSPTEALILRRVRMSDFGNGCRRPLAELGHRMHAGSLSVRQIRRVVAALLTKGLLVDRGRVARDGGGCGPRILLASPWRASPASPSQPEHR